MALGKGAPDRLKGEVGRWGKFSQVILCFVLKEFLWEGRKDSPYLPQVPQTATAMLMDRNASVVSSK